MGWIGICSIVFFWRKSWETGGLTCLTS
jgi:hypothetical protein